LFSKAGNGRKSTEQKETLNNPQQAALAEPRDDLHMVCKPLLMMEKRKKKRKGKEKTGREFLWVGFRSGASVVWG
jgi:hypothetical protein